MERKLLLKKLREETRNASIAYYNYMFTDREYVKGHPLHLREIHFLSVVGDCSPITITEIGNKLGITQSAASQIASRLLTKKLIEKVKSQKDRRYSVVILTSVGQKIYEEYCRYNEQRTEDVDSCFQDISEEELEIIIQYERTIQKIFRGELAKNTTV
ncbi:MAG: MarR family winged helix-turn-helix transcriptional regulator [Lachnospiraceae bacterium]|nr:MarR family winged helix-turn-helix transcriptional regulator [Lachnospiraceae bacterium]